MMKDLQMLCRAVLKIKYILSEKKRTEGLIESKNESVESNCESLESKNESITSSCESLDSRSESVDSRSESVDLRRESVESKSKSVVLKCESTKNVNVTSKSKSLEAKNVYNGSFLSSTETNQFESSNDGCQASQMEVETCFLQDGLDVDHSSGILDLDKLDRIVSPVDDDLEFLDDKFNILDDFLYPIPSFSNGIHDFDPELVKEISDNEIVKFLEKLSDSSVDCEHNFCNMVQESDNPVKTFLNEGKEFALPFLKKARRSLESKNIFISDEDWETIRKKRLKFRRQKKYKSKCLNKKRKDVMNTILSVFEKKGIHFYA